MQIPRQPCTTEFKALAVTRVKNGMTAGVAAKELGLIEQTLRNWIESATVGKLRGESHGGHTGVDGTVTTARRERATETRERHSKTSDGVRSKGHPVRDAWM
jgi:transposase